MTKQEEFDLGPAFAKQHRVYASGPYVAKHMPGESTAEVTHRTDPGNVIDNINVRTAGGPQVALNKWHSDIRRTTR